jgi:hypothetical protein
VAGVYLLVASDGVASPPDGFSTLSLTPRLVDALPTYGWRVFAASGQVSGEDFGTWSAGGGRVEFRSTKGAGTYASRVARASDGAALLEVTAAGARRYTFRRVRVPGAPSAYLRLAVVDAASGVQVPGARFDITSGDGLREFAASTADAPYVTAGGPGEWTVAFTPPAGYALALGEANPRRVTIAAGTDRTGDVRFTVVRPGR